MSPAIFKRIEALQTCIVYSYIPDINRYNILFLAPTKLLYFKAPCTQLCQATPLGVLATGTQSSVVSNDLGALALEVNKTAAVGMEVSNPWGYPQSSISNDGIFPPKKDHPAIWGNL